MQLHAKVTEVHLLRLSYDQRKIMGQVILQEALLLMH